jgi:hypothetical protein
MSKFTVWCKNLTFWSKNLTSCYKEVSKWSQVLGGVAVDPCQDLATLGGGGVHMCIGISFKKLFATNICMLSLLGRGGGI